MVHHELEALTQLDSSSQQTDRILLLSSQVIQLLGLTLSAAITPLPVVGDAVPAQQVLSPAAVFEVTGCESSETNTLASESLTSLLDENPPSGLSSVAALIEQVVTNTRTHLHNGKPMLSYMAYKGILFLEFLHVPLDC
jgi:hypothetical protein